MPVRAIVYLKAGITSVPIGHPGEPSVIWGNPEGIWHREMRSWEWGESGLLLVAWRPPSPSTFSPCAAFTHGCWELLHWKIDLYQSQDPDLGQAS
jgi:hypothetical protein